MSVVNASQVEAVKRWVCVYPVYINSSKKQSEGRKLPKSQCCENPRSNVMAECAVHLKFKTALEVEKRHPRDFFTFGRVRVNLFKEDGSPQNPEIPNRLALYREIAKLVPRYKPAEKPAGVAGGSGGGGSGAGGGGKGGGGKGKDKKKKKGKK